MVSSMGESVECDLAERDERDDSTTPECRAEQQRRDAETSQRLLETITGA